GEVLAEALPFGPRADQPDRAQIASSQGSRAQVQVLGVVVGHDEHVAAGRKPDEHFLADDGELPTDPRDRRLEAVEGLELFGPGVGYDEVEVVSAQYPGEFESDVADAEDRRRGGHGQRFEQHRDLPTAALTTVFGRRLVVELQ